jgi:hypothetical protein
MVYHVDNSSDNVFEVFYRLTFLTSVVIFVDLCFDFVPVQSSNCQMALIATVLE